MPESILIADDDKAMLNLYTRIFSGRGYVFTLAASFSEAAGLIKNNDYDLLVTDLMFPDGIGTELMKLFEGKKAGAKSLLVTGYAPIADLPGTAQCFEKPFKVETFMAAVEKALRV